MSKEIAYDLGLQFKGPEYKRGVEKIAAWHRQCKIRRLIAAKNNKKTNKQTKG